MNVASFLAQALASVREDPAMSMAPPPESAAGGIAMPTTGDTEVARQETLRWHIHARQTGVSLFLPCLTSPEMRTVEGPCACLLALYRQSSGRLSHVMIGKILDFAYSPAIEVCGLAPRCRVDPSDGDFSELKTKRGNFYNAYDAALSCILTRVSDIGTDAFPPNLSFAWPDSSKPIKNSIMQIATEHRLFRITDRRTRTVCWCTARAVSASRTSTVLEACVWLVIRNPLPWRTDDWLYVPNDEPEAVYMASAPKRRFKITWVHGKTLCLHGLDLTGLCRVLKIDRSLEQRLRRTPNACDVPPNMRHLKNCEFKFSQVGSVENCPMVLRSQRYPTAIDGKMVNFVGDSVSQQLEPTQMTPAEAVPMCAAHAGGNTLPSGRGSTMAEVIEFIEPAAQISPEEAALVSQELWASGVQRHLMFGPSLPSLPPPPPGLVVILLGRNPKGLEEALSSCLPAARLSQKGFDVRPSWACGAWVLAEGARAEQFEELGNRHVVVSENELEEVHESLRKLPYNIRPRIKPGMGIAHVPSNSSLLDVSANATSIGDPSSSRIHASETNSEGDEKKVGFASSHMSLPLIVRRTFIDFPQSPEVSPRSAQTV